MQRLGRLKPLLAVSLLLTLSSCSQCTKQHDPSRDLALFKSEQSLANRPVQRLTADGQLPQPPRDPNEPKETRDPILVKYEQFCSTCHGIKGHGDGPGAQALNPKPRNLTDSQWQASVDDAHIHKVIKEGGAAVGLSAGMAPWGAVLKDPEIDGMVKLVRSFVN